MIPVLRDYQRDLFDRVRAARARGARRIVVQAPTGAGKTSWFAFVAKQAVEKGSKVFCLVHRRRLVEQISSRFEEFEVPHGVIMRGEHPWGSAPVQVASRDTIISRCFTHEWTGLPPGNLVIVDEAHHAADPESEYRRILANYPQATVLLVTATPVGPDGRGLGPWAQAIECAAPTSQLVRDGFLLPVRCYAPDRKTKRGKVQRGIAGDLVQSWKEFAEGRPTVLFTSRVQHSLDAVEAFLAAGIAAKHIDADTDDDTRDRTFAGLEDGSVKVVSNVGIIKEGVDIPCLGCCQIYMEMNGRVAFVQAVGRIMRPHPGQEYGILIDHAGAVFRHGFPDEDMTWTLEGNADDDFRARKKDGDTAQPHYCKHCDLVYHDQVSCPQCGRQPVKPPRSIFAPPAIDASDELLTECDRKQEAGAFSRESKIKTWLACLGVAANRNSTFGMAGAMYRKKYNEFPGDDFPCVPERWRWKERVAERYPQFARRKRQTN